MLAWLNRQAPRALPFGLVVGVVWQDLAALLRPGVTPLIFLLTLASFLRIEWREIVAAMARPLPVIATAVAILCVCPLVIAALSGLLPSWLAIPLVLQAAAPPIGSAPVMAVMIGLDGAFALVTTVLATALVPMTLPPLIEMLGGVRVAFDALAMGVRLAAVIGGAALLAWGIKRLMGARVQRHAAEVGGLTVVVMLLFAVAIMDGVVAMALANPWQVAGLALGGVMAAVAWGTLAALLCWRWCGGRRALTLALLTGNRNLGLVLAGLGAAAPADYLVYVAVAQLPIYLVPLAMQPLARRWGSVVASKPNSVD
ncbi:MAG: hypothetical protein EAZ99_15230 [Alphaproteobacteria bacterium]|nr:MAG: hypothetical protein EAZ99_15230 [Alphaproteobacteria bacterium]